MILLIGTDESLLEGLTQLLAGNGQRVRIAHSVAEAEEIAVQTLPLLVVVNRELVTDDGGARVCQIALAPGGAYVLYRAMTEEGGSLALPHSIARQTLADLSLPLERQRLLALAQYVGARARGSGRARSDTPPEQRVP
ncbi:MAG: hypothetical protein ABI910_15485 [Gemmatimonadota bacterium]